MPFSKHCPAKSWLVYGFLMILVLTACSNSTIAPPSSLTKASPQVSSMTASPTPKPGAPGCKPPSPVDESNLGFPEVQGTTQSMDLWALFLGYPRAKEDGKILWKVGIGFDDPIHIVGLGPHGLRILPFFGPELHTGSSWNRPGGEYGTGFKFPVAGCWNLHVTGGKGVGDVWLVVQ